jgi:hypothetical protein
MTNDAKIYRGTTTGTATKRETNTFLDVIGISVAYFVCNKCSAGLQTFTTQIQRPIPRKLYQSETNNGNEEKRAERNHTVANIQFLVEPQVVHIDANRATGPQNWIMEISASEERSTKLDIRWNVLND